MQVIRKRGAPLGNWNALKSGKYSPRRRAERRARRVAEFEGKCRRQTTGHLRRDRCIGASEGHAVRKFVRCG